MKRFVFLSFILCISILGLSIEPIQTVYAETKPIYYKILENNTAFFRTPNEDIYFILPPTYFVKFKSSFDEEWLEVEYQDFSGFVRRSDVARVYSAPATPYLTDIIFTPQKVANLVIRTRPSTQSDFVGTIPYTASEVTYYGWVEGEKANPKLDNIWYFCRYTSPEQGSVTGYVYAPLTENLSPILSNDEVVDTTPSSPVAGEIEIAPELKDESNLLFIAFLTIPAIFILILVFRSQNKRPKSLKNRLKDRYLPPPDELDF